jgi:DNA modification methylase
VAQGDRVADPFAGIASTLVAAKQTPDGSTWGCEVDAEYLQAGEKRL